MLLSEGIANQPEAWTDWLNRAIPFFNRQDGWCSQGILYATTALTVEVHEAERVNTFADILKAYNGEQIHLCGHSNGTRVIVSGWQKAGCPRIETVHLICGAADSDFETLGLNEGLRQNQIGQVFVYYGGQDEAMRAENTWLGTKLFELPEGHVPLGLHGPTNIDPDVASRVHVSNWLTYNHSTCFDSDHFNITMQTILDNASAVRP